LHGGDTVAAKYRKIDPRIWDDEVFDALDAPDALAALWLISGRAVNRAGVVVAGLGEVADKLRLQGVDASWDTLSRVCPSLSWPLQKVGRNTVVVILRSWFKYNAPTNDDHLAGMLSDLSDVPRCELLYSYETTVKPGLAEKWHATLDRVCLELMTPCTTVTPPPCPPQKQKQKQEQKQEQEQKKKGAAPRFNQPTIDEVADYCTQRKNTIDAEQFVDHYEARGWELTKGRRMKDWKACVRTWEKNDFSQNGKSDPPYVVPM
jgi:hypothetical protein